MIINSPRKNSTKKTKAVANKVVFHVKDDKKTRVDSIDKTLYLTAFKTEI